VSVAERYTFSLARVPTKAAPKRSYGGCFHLFHAVFCSILQELTRGHTYYSVDYAAELKQWAEAEYYLKNVHRFQLPFTPVC
jgi:hypothetical protein